MGADRLNEFSGPCPCGKGTLEVDYCEPDHGWPTSTRFWYEASIQCLSCSKIYATEQRGRNFVLVERKDLEKSKALYNEASSIAATLMKTATVIALVDSLIALLEEQPSMAATHRLLCGAGLECSSVATFSKRWSGARVWVESHVSAANLYTIMGFLGSKDTEIEQTLSQIAELSKTANVPVPIVGKPFYTHD